MVNYLFVVWYVLIHYNAETFGVVVVVLKSYIKLHCLLFIIYISVHSHVIYHISLPPVLFQVHNCLQYAY